MTLGEFPSVTFTPKNCESKRELDSRFVRLLDSWKLNSKGGPQPWTIAFRKNLATVLLNY